MRDGQPRNRYRLNRAHALSNGCMFLPMFDPSDMRVRDVMLDGHVLTLIEAVPGTLKPAVRFNAYSQNFDGAGSGSTPDDYYSSDVAPVVDTNRITVWGYFVHVTASGSKMILARYQQLTSAATQFRISTETNRLGAHFRGASSVTFTGATTLTGGQSYHLFATYDGTTGTIYLNGVSDGSASVSTTMNTSALRPYSVGNNTGSTDAPFNGFFFCGGVWNRILSVGEMTELIDDPWCMLEPDPAPLMMRTWRIPVYGGAIAGQGVAANPTLRGRGWQ